MSELPEAPQSRVEEWLAVIAGMEGVEPEPPQSRVEKWLAYIAENGGGSTAADVAYDNTESGLTAENVQDAIDELSKLSVPPATSADNGKFLRVVDGEPAWATVPVVEGGSY